MKKQIGCQLILIIFILLSTDLSSGQPRSAADKNDVTRLLLSAGFLTVVKEARIDLDSCLVIAGQREGLSRIPIITEGLSNDVTSENCKWMDSRDPSAALTQLNMLKGTEHAKLLLLLGAYYAFQSGAKLINLNSAQAYLNKAKAENTALGLPSPAMQCEILLGKCFMKEGKVAEGKAAFQVAADYALKYEDRAMLAKLFNYEGVYSPFTPDILLFRIGCLNKANKIYGELGDVRNQINTLMDIAYLSFANRQIRESETAASHSLQLQRSIKFKYTHYSIDLLAFIARLKGNYALELQYALEGISSAEATRDSLGLGYFYARVADGYLQDHNQVSETNVWYKKALNEFVKHGGDRATYRILTGASFIETGLGGYGAALEMLKALIKDYPPDNTIDQQNAYLAFATCYDNLGQHAIAEKYYLMAEKLEVPNQRIRGNIDGGFVYYRLGGFYLRKRDFKKSKEFTLKYIANPSGASMDSLLLTDAYWSLAQADSALGGFESMRTLYNYTILQKNLHKGKEQGRSGIKYPLSNFAKAKGPADVQKQEFITDPASQNGPEILYGLFDHPIIGHFYYMYSLC